MIDPLLISLFLLVFEERWLLRAGEVDAQQKWEIEDTEFAPRSSATHNDARII
jgi:hypothetical protein